MKIKFRTYTYYDPDTQGEDLEFNWDFDDLRQRIANNPNDKEAERLLQQYGDYEFKQEVVDNYINNNDYTNASKLLNKYKPNDVEDLKEYNNYVHQFNHEARIMNGIYSQIDDKDTKAKIKFANNVFTENGLDNFIGDQDVEPYIKKFNDIKGRIGSSDKKKATSLSIEFQPKQQTLFGIDWLMPDNTSNSLEAFYERTGLTEGDLRAAGVEVTHPDGKDVIKFKKNNKYANQIIAGLRLYQGSYGDMPIRDRHYYNNVIRGYDDAGNEIDGNPWWNDVIRFKNMIKDASEVKEAAFEKVRGNKNYSSTIGPLLTDGIDQVEKQFAEGKINETEYHRRKKELYDWVEQGIMSLGSQDFQMYTNYGGNWSDPTLKEVPSDKRRELVEWIGANIDKVKINSMLSNGQAGALITIPARTKTAKDIDSDKRTTENLAERAIHVFVPGLFMEKVQEQINRDSKMRAMREINSMQDYGYGWDCSDGTELHAMDGVFWKEWKEVENGREVTKTQQVSQEDAVREINRTMIIEDAVNNLPFQFMNHKGEVFDREGYENMAAQWAYKAGEELYGNIPLQTSRGDNIDFLTAFAMKGAGVAIKSEYDDILPYETRKKLLEIYSIYHRITNELNRYNTNYPQ